MEAIFLLGLILGLGMLWLFELIHCIMNQRLSDANRVIGVILLVFAAPIGMIAYPLIPRR